MSRASNEITFGLSLSAQNLKHVLLAVTPLAVLCWQLAALSNGGVRTLQIQSARTLMVDNNDRTETKDPSQPFMIFQISPERTGSTLMTNLLMGLFDEPGASACPFGHWISGSGACERNIVVKGHGTNIEGFSNQIAQQYSQDVLFVSTTRGNVGIGEEYCAQWANVLCIEYEEFVYTNDAGRRRAVSSTVQRIKEAFPRLAEVDLDEFAAIERLREMDQVTEAMKDEPYTAVNSQFHVHGSHRSHDEYLAVANQPPSQQPPFLIFQLSPPKTGTMMMTNLLLGLFDEPHSFTCGAQWWMRGGCQQHHVVQSYGTNVEEMQRLLTTSGWGEKPVFFVSTRRGGTGLSDKTCTDRYNVLCFEYEDILYLDETDMRDVVNRVATRIRERFPYLWRAVMDVDGAVRRLIELDRAAESTARDPHYANTMFTFHPDLVKQQQEQREAITPLSGHKLY